MNIEKVLALKAIYDMHTKEAERIKASIKIPAIDGYIMHIWLESAVPILYVYKGTSSIGAEFSPKAGKWECTFLGSLTNAEYIHFEEILNADSI